jgi:predicted acetyltransferase
VSIETRRIRDEELPEFVETMSAAFLERPDVEKVIAQVRPLWDLERVWGAFEDGRMCGTFRSWSTELTVPGGEGIPAASVSAVSVLPTHRRRGILSGLVAAEHGAMRERGEAVAMLYASEYPIYGRFGYGPGTREATWTLDTRGTGFHGHPTGGVELAKPDLDTAAAMKGVFEAWRVRQPGELRRRDFRWEYDLGIRESVWGPTWKGFVAFHRDASGSVDGYVRYHVEDKWEQRQPRNVVNVDELHALTDESYASLWRFLAEMDWAATVKAERRGPAERLPWLLTNARAAEMSGFGDGLWVRLIDVARALQARMYEREGSIVLEIVDREAAGGRTRVLLDAGPAGAACSETDRSPDLTLDVAALSAAFLGGVPLRNAVAARGGVEEHRTGALADAEALLRTRDEPWASTFF